MNSEFHQRNNIFWFKLSISWKGCRSHRKGSKVISCTKEGLVPRTTQVIYILNHLQKAASSKERRLDGWKYVASGSYIAVEAPSKGAEEGNVCSPTWVGSRTSLPWLSRKPSQLLTPYFATRTKEGKNISQDEYAFLISFIELFIWKDRQPDLP
jgi:hypothetical protein